MPGLQVNFNQWSIDRSFPLMNLAKTGQEWSSDLTNERPNPGFMDANGYLTDFSEGGVRHYCQVPTQAQRPGKLVLRAAGDGVMSVAGGYTAGSGNLTSSGGAIRYEFLPDSDMTAFTIGIASRGTGYINSHALIHIDDENDYVNNGKRVSNHLKTRIAEAGFTTIRFLNVQYANGSFHSLRSHMGGPGLYTYAAGVPLLGSFKGITTKTSNDFQLSGVSTSPANKTTIQFIFGQNGDASSTLMGKPLRTMWGASTQYPADLGWSAAWTPAAGKHCIAVFDTALNCWLMAGGNAVHEDVRGLQIGPLEPMLDICNETNCKPWLHIPHHAVDPLTSFTADMAADVIASLNPSLVAIYEVSNEVWNSAGGFWQTRYAWERQKVRTGKTGGEPNDQDEIDEWYGRAVAQVGEVIDAAYGGDRTRYEMLCQTQGANWPRTRRLTSPQWVAENGGNTAKAAKNWVTAGGWANYWNPAAQLELAGTDLDAMVTEYQTATTARKDELLAELLNDNSFTRGTFPTIFAGQAAWMTAQGVTRYFCYEGGYSPDYLSYLGSSPRDQFLKDSKNHPELVRWTLVSFYHCIANGVLEPSVFQLSGAFNIWSVLDPDIFVTPDPPQWTAFKLYKAGRFRFKATSV